MAKVVALEEQTQPLRALSAAELQTYDEQGFIILDNVFPPADVTALNNEIERLMPEHGDTTANRPGWILQIGLRSELISSFARDERILSLIEDIVPPRHCRALGEVGYQSAAFRYRLPLAPGRSLLHEARRSQDA